MDLIKNVSNTEFEYGQLSVRKESSINQSE